MATPPASFTVQVPGLGRLQRELRRAGAGLGDLKEANQRAGRVVVAAAAIAAPKGRTRRLAGSGRASRAAGRVSVLWGGAAVPYAGPIHWGWKARHIEAQPFVVEAAQATEPVWLDGYATDVQRLLDDVGGTY